jgi:hypothetical protein
VDTTIAGTVPADIWYPNVVASACGKAGDAAGKRWLQLVRFALVKAAMGSILMINPVPVRLLPKYPVL